MEYETDWAKMMEIVLKTFEEVNNVVPDINVGLNTILINFAKNVWIGASQEVKVVTELCDEKYFLSRNTNSFVDDFLPFSTFVI